MDAAHEDRGCLGGRPAADAARESSLSAEVLKAARLDEVPTPFDRSYWVLPGRFLAGAYPGDPVVPEAEKKLRAFLAAGIRCFVDLTMDGDCNLFGQPLIPYLDLLTQIAGRRFRIICRRMPVADLGTPSRSQMEEILDVVDGAIISGLPAYVHCLGGIGRTGTVVGCWLVRHGIASGQDAIRLIAKLRRNEARTHITSPETEDQRRFIRDWKQGD